MYNKQLILVLNNQGQAGVVEFPVRFPLPDKKTVGERTYYKTDRIRRLPDGDATIYTEARCPLNLDDYATDTEDAQ